MIRKNIFRHLYFQVLVAIIAGAGLGFFYPRPEPLGLNADGSLAEPHTKVAGQEIKLSSVPTNVLESVKRYRPDLQVDTISATPEPYAVYRITFQKRVGIALKPLGDIFIKLIRMVVAPIIFCTVVIGMAGMGSVKRVGRV